MNRLKRGFTLIEIIVVIAVIGIMTTLTVVGFNRYQADTRDARRVASVKSIAEALEKYYDSNGEYPSCTSIEQSASTVSTSVLTGIDQSVLVAPQSAPGENNSLRCDVLSPNGEDFFEYSGDGSSSCMTGLSCLTYTLKYKEEATGTVKELASRRNTSIATSDVTTVTIDAVQASTVDLSWLAVANADGYKVQRATNSGFTTGLIEADISGTHTTISGLSASTLYYFRVAATNNSNMGSYSAAVSTTTSSIDAPVINCSTVASLTQLTLTWPAVSGASSYTLQRSTSSSFTSPTVTSGITATSQAVTGLSTGTLYYFRMQTVSGSATSAWSSTCSGGPVATPTNIGISVPACAQATLTWTVSSGATNYRIQHAADSGFSSPTTATGFTGTSGTVTGVPQGTTRYFRVLAQLGSAVSAPSSSVNATTTICPPNSYTISFTGGTSLDATSNAVCAAGTANYYWYANGSPWVNGDQYQSVSYGLGYGQSVTLTVTTRCYDSNGTSVWAAASNSASYTRPGLVILGIQKISGGSSNGHRVHTWWNNLCGGTNQVIGYQGSYNTGWISPMWNGSNNPAAGASSMPSSTNDVRNWSSSGYVTMYARQDCGGWQQSSNSGYIYA